MRNSAKNTCATEKRWLMSVKSLKLPIRQKLKLSIRPYATNQDFLRLSRNGNGDKRTKRKRAGEKPLQRLCPQPPKAWQRPPKLFYRSRRSRRRKHWILIDDFDGDLSSDHHFSWMIPPPRHLLCS